MKKIITLIVILLVLIGCKKQIKSPSIIETHISTDTFKQQIALNGAQLIDVRTSIEYSQGHIENAKMIDYNDASFINNAMQFLDKSKPVYVYCLSGGKRSQNSVKLLREKGYKVQDLIGGIAGWQKKGYKIVKPHKEVDVLK